MSVYNFLEQMLVAAAAMVRPPERLTVAEAAEKYVYLNYPGAYVGYYSNELAPYMREPMEVLTSRDFTSMAFVGPARAGKSQVFLNWVGYSAVCDPADMIMAQPSTTSARDFSMRDLGRMLRYSPEVKSRMIQRLDADNTFDKSFASGMLLKLSWPSINEFSGKTVGRSWLADYDRFPESIDGEGSGFALLKRRAQTFKRNGMTVAESSPGFPVENPKWQAKTPHEAPPCKGILSLYNSGDRRRFYWRCPHCSEAFEGDFKHLQYPKTKDFGDAAAQAVMVCPANGCIIRHDPNPSTGDPGKHGLNLGGKWLREREIWLPDNSTSGGIKSDDMASFWLKGTAAAFNTWEKLVLDYLKAEDDYERTGSEEALKVTINTGQGLPYVSKNHATERLPEELKARERDFGHKVVPMGVRFLVATVDVQKHRFVVQIQGVGVNGEMWIVDRFDIRKSKRKDDDGDMWPVHPSTYLEDWDLLITQVLTKTYPLADDSGRSMQIKVVGCDSGGDANKDGDGSVTANAYNFYRRMRLGEDEIDPNLFRRFQLIKGGSKAGPRWNISYPDTQRKDRHASARGEIPVMFLNPNALKDQVSGMLDRTDPKGARINFPNWLPDSWYAELTAEVRTEKGWENPRRLRNESFDLLYYALGLCLSSHIGIERIDWDKPPTWAAEWETNSLVVSPNSPSRFAPKQKVAYDLSQLAAQLA